MNIHNHKNEAKTPGNICIRGTISFQAKLCNDGSQFGIKDCRIDNLTAWDQEYCALSEGHDTLISFDRGWIIQPYTPEEDPKLQALLEYFENSSNSKN